MRPLPRFAFPTCPATQLLCEATATEMQHRFGISSEEAVGRINRHWSGQDLSDPNDIVLHEGEGFWAKTIFYSQDSSWWLDESKAVPKPYP